MTDHILHRPQRGIVPIPLNWTEPDWRRFVRREGPALVTYHAPRYVVWQGRPSLDLGLPCLATWGLGDGSWDMPPGGSGGTPAQASTDLEAA